MKTQAMLSEQVDETENFGYYYIDRTMWNVFNSPNSFSLYGEGRM